MEEYYFMVLSYFTVCVSVAKAILTDQINGRSHKDGSMLVRDRLMSKSGEFWWLGVSSLMKETDRQRQTKTDKDKEDICGG